MYTPVTGLDWLADEGVNLQTTTFWGLARRAKQEINDKPKHTLAMALPVVLMDKKIHSRMKQSFLKGVSVPHSLTSDVNISNVGRYPYRREHRLSQDANDINCGVLTVESLHVYHPLPHLASSATLFITAVDSFNYSMAHKCENVVGRRFSSQSSSSAKAWTTSARTKHFWKF